MEPKALIYQMPLEKAAQIAQALVPMGIGIRLVSPGETGQKVGYLAGLPGCPAGDRPRPAGPGPQGEFLLMCGFTKGQLDTFLGLFQKGELAPVPVKAVMTETNRDWSFGRLLREVYSEHQFMTRRRG